MDNGIRPINGLKGTQLIGNKVLSSPKTDVEFTDVLKNAINQVVDDMKTAEKLNSQLVTGEVKDLHQVMTAMEKANLGLQLTVQVRNKVVEAYQEIMRMQV